MIQELVSGWLIIYLLVTTPSESSGIEDFSCQLSSLHIGACQFALAALKQVDEARSLRDGSHVRRTLDESVVTIKGRLWSNVFKFTSDLNHFHDAYCTIISNPDGESKQICLLRSIIVLYELRAMKGMDVCAESQGCRRVSVRCEEKCTAAVSAYCDESTQYR
ncbi:unnamed protein product [Linum tenue]|uniref:NUP160 middle TPR domain-containing protein n=1 Tax=Linum tenue TaxID=586396 RepID=A0AAV0HIA1_9ROSI|nr:unnamed protein product [Linum tenue]